LSINFKELKTISSSLLCPPGNGVYTVNTAKEKKEQLHKTLYGTTIDIETSWNKKFDGLPLNHNACMLGICSDSGGGIHRGANWGPLYLRELLYNENKNLPCFDLGDIRVNPHLLHDRYLNEQTIASCRKSMFGDANSKYPVSPLSMTEYFLDNFYEVFPNKKVFSIGGDHSVSYPLVKSYLKKCKREKKKAAIIHFDAHTDLLTERLGIDLCFGSWVPHILDDLESPSLMYQIGIRSSGKDKKYWEDTFGVQQFWSDEVKKLGPSVIANQIIEDLKNKNVDELYISFDIDALDSDFASATGTPEPNGLTPHEPMVILQKLYDEFKFGGADLVEIAPLVKGESVNHPEPQTTLMVASTFANFLLEALN
jgi:agmatinase